MRPNPPSWKPFTSALMIVVLPVPGPPVIRENFSKKANEYLARNNIAKRIDPRTFEEQGREELPQIHLGTSSYQMEKKGIQTERGNQNRKIIALNLEFRKLKEELSKLTSWIGSLLGSLQVKYDEYKQEKKEEYENKAELFNLYEYISIYYDLQGEKGQPWQPLFASISCLIWVIYGWTKEPKKDYILIIPNATGVILGFLTFLTSF